MYFKVRISKLVTLTDVISLLRWCVVTQEVVAPNTGSIACVLKTNWQVAWLSESEQFRPLLVVNLSALFEDEFDFSLGKV